MSYDPDPSASELRLDSSEALQQHSSEPLAEGIAGQRLRRLPAFVEQFTATIRSSACGSAGASDYSDARYYLDRAIPKSGSTSTQALSTQADTLPGVQECLTATNLAELANGSHLLASGTVVQVSALWTRSGTKVYVFNQPPPGGAVVKITGSGGGGKYTGSLLVGASTATSSGTLAMPEGMTTGASAVILNQEEDGQTGHRLQIPCYAVGQIVGNVGGTPTVMIRGALGASAGATSLSGSGLSADSNSWSRSSNGTPVTVSIQTRTYWDSTGGVLYAYLRTLSFDARGLLVSVSAESQVTVDTPTACQ